MGIFRFAPKSEEARIKILTDGISVRGKKVFLMDKNPRREDNEGIRLMIFDLPFSYDNEAIKRNLEGEGIKCMSEVKKEMLRSPRGGLTDWESGDRYVYIQKPEKPIKRKMKMGKFTAALWYKNMTEDQICTNCQEKGHGFWQCKHERVCRKCRQQGHGHWQCPNEPVCWTCHKPGHKAGDHECEINMDEDNEQNEESEDEEEDKNKAANEENEKIGNGLDA